MLDGEERPEMTSVGLGWCFSTCGVSPVSEFKMQMLVPQPPHTPADSWQTTLRNAEPEQSLKIGDPGL